MKKEPIDFGTQELQAKRTIVPRLRDRWNMHAKVMDSCELDRMLMNGLIDVHQHGTLERFAEILYKGGFMRMKSIDWSDPVSSGDPSHIADRKARSMARVAKMFSHIDEKIGKQPRIMLVEMVIADVPMKGKPDIKGMVLAINEFIDST